MIKAIEEDVDLYHQYMRKPIENQQKFLHIIYEITAFPFGMATLQQGRWGEKNGTMPQKSSLTFRNMLSNVERNTITN